jgi:hypothetical protein
MLWHTLKVPYSDSETPSRSDKMIEQFKELLCQHLRHICDHINLPGKAVILVQLSRLKQLKRLTAIGDALFCIRNSWLVLLPDLGCSASSFIPTLMPEFMPVGVLHTLVAFFMFGSAVEYNEARIKRDELRYWSKPAIRNWISRSDANYEEGEVLR